ncbi:hypothetical protein GCM10023063_38800 [Arthrobacter methylotrophus]|uniref:Uncharacterized protein n=1 Tax=Arthrobacter methylotrophus TaxID=121291 RepID=A0ABV5UTS2_9MICC
MSATDNERRQDLGLPVIPDPPEHHCTKGWLSETPDGLPIPCLTCRPWLRPNIRATPKTIETPTQKDN